MTSRPYNTRGKTKLSAQEDIELDGHFILFTFYKHDKATTLSFAAL